MELTQKTINKIERMLETRRYKGMGYELYWVTAHSGKPKLDVRLQSGVAIGFSCVPAKEDIDNHIAYEQKNQNTLI